MNSNDWISTLAPYVPAIVALITSVPILISALIKHRSDMPKSQAEAVSTLVATMQSMYDPLNDRIKIAESECYKMRQIDRIQREIISLKTDYASYLLAGIKALANQLEGAGLTPVFILNGEMAEYRVRLDATWERLQELEVCEY